jgi:hypothetical protein
MNLTADYESWATVTKVIIDLECGCIIPIPIVAAVDAQAVLDKISITSYLIHRKLPCGSRME